MGAEAQALRTENEELRESVEHLGCAVEHAQVPLPPLGTCMPATWKRATCGKKLWEISSTARSMLTACKGLLSQPQDLLAADCICAALTARLWPAAGVGGSGRAAGGGGAAAAGCSAGAARRPLPQPRSKLTDRIQQLNNQLVSREPASPT